MTKEHILSEVRKAAKANAGVPPGRERFERETGIRESYWRGRFWVSWGDVLRDAGFAVNPWNTAYPEEFLLESYARLARELGRVPTAPHMRLKRRADSTFPNDEVFFARFGDKAAVLARVRQFCNERGEFNDVLAILGPFPSNSTSPLPRHAMPVGFVYLTKFGRHFKIGRTNAIGRRERELAIQLPEKSKTVHAIETDDPEVRVPGRGGNSVGRAA